MSSHAVPTGVSGRHERVRAAAAAARRRPRQGHRDCVVAPSARGVAAPARRAAGPVHIGRSGVAGRAAAPAAEADLAAPAAAGPARHDPQVAPRPDRRPPCRGVAAPSPRPTPHAAVNPDPGTAPGTREQQLGISASARRTAHARDHARPVHRLGDPARGRDRPRAPSRRHHLGRLPALPSRSAAGRGLHRDRHAERGANIHFRRHRARQPPGAHPGRHRPPHRGLGDPGRPQWTCTMPGRMCGT
jgi:hypothetical protein